MHSTIARFGLVLTIAGIVLAVAAVSAGQQGPRERSVLVGVSGSNDTPVKDMTAADFTVRENGVAREILRVSPAPPPSHVLLLIDDSQIIQNPLAYLRSATAAFITRMSELKPAPPQAFWTFGERPTRRADFTPNVATVSAAAGRVFPLTGSGAYFMQGVIDACDDLKKKGAPSPVIVAFVAESGPEFSNSVHSQVADALKAAGASLWVVVLQIGGQPMNTSEARERAAVIGDVTTDSGGMSKVVLSGQGLESAFDAVAGLITSRYLVTYGRPDALVPPNRIEVSTRRRDVRILASKWAGQSTGAGRGAFRPPCSPPRCARAASRRSRCFAAARMPWR